MRSVEFREHWLPVLAIGVIVSIGLLRLLEPIGGDQALQMAFASRLWDGEVVYLDVWDLRQPLNMWWYATIGRIFGTGEIALRLGELLWQTTLAVLIVRDVRSSTGSNRLAAVTGLATVGYLLLVTRPGDIAQPETLVLLPLYLAYRIVNRREAASLRRSDLVWCGVLAGIVGLFKITYGPIVVGFVVLHAWRHRAGAAQIVRAVAWFVAGGLLVLVPLLVYLGVNGALGAAATTFFRDGPAMRALASPDRSRLAWSLRLLPLALPAAVTLWRGRGRPRPWGELLGWTWLVLGAVALAPQQWWPYQWLVLVVPLGLISAPTIDRFLSSGRAAVAATAVGLVLVAAVGFRDLPSAVVAVGIDRAAIAEEYDITYRQRDELSAFLAEPERIEGDAYVMGNPIILLGLDRDDHVSVHGWSPEFLSPELWERLEDELQEGPPAYILVDGFSSFYLRERAPDLWSWITMSYDELPGPVESVVVYERRVTTRGATDE